MPIKSNKKKRKIIEPLIMYSNIIKEQSIVWIRAVNRYSQTQWLYKLKKKGLLLKYLGLQVPTFTTYPESDETENPIAINTQVEPTQVLVFILRNQKKIPQFFFFISFIAQNVCSIWRLYVKRIKINYYRPAPANPHDGFCPNSLLVCKKRLYLCPEGGSRLS